MNLFRLTSIATALAVAAVAAAPTDPWDAHKPVIQPRTVAQSARFITAKVQPNCVPAKDPYFRCKPTAECYYDDLSHATLLFYQSQGCNPGSPSACKMDMGTFCKMCTMFKGTPSDWCVP
ncbi:uncharacterized protein PSFLO_01055 [Pseudozyma flocculosa]|uniref:Uncharacterized protein n=1 Tax=Pseudozyma flocculosa TaxID=84751 RepID=A0A5C3ETB5_9BASI|nr:uncharacterized protein PSFLO_01055 [Pseudozyma flocculosa]